jgi:hypothetical protein
VCALRYRAKWLAKIAEPGVRRRTEFHYQQFDALAALRQQLGESSLLKAESISR